MDAFTHAVVGAAVGLSLSRMRGYRPRLIAAGCGILASEAPDADRIFDTWLNPFGADGSGLAYLLYHRGVTHTVGSGLLLAAVIAFGFALAFRCAGQPAARLIIIAILATSLHLLMDASNDYGVHPFWPLTSRWFFGDAVFLAEPTIAASLIPFVVGSLVKRRALRIALSSALVALYVSLLTWYGGWGIGPVAMLLVIGGFFGQCIAQRNQPKPQIAWLSVGLVFGAFFTCSRLARANARSQMQELRPDERLTDVVTTPAPGNPLCWRVIVVTRGENRFVARLGVTSLVRPLVNERTCFQPPHGLRPETVPLPASDLPEAPGWVWSTRFEGSVEAFESFSRVNRRVNESRRFLRVPFWGPGRGRLAGRIVIGDLRLDYAPADLAKYCKYPFEECRPQELDAPAVFWTPPFFDEGVAREPRASDCSDP